MYSLPPGFADLELHFKPMIERFPDVIFRARGGNSGKHPAKMQIALPFLIAVSDRQVCLGGGHCKAAQTKC